MEECYKALSDQLDWNNLEGDSFPFDLRKHLPLKGRRGRLTEPLEYFFNNDLEYLKSSDPEKKDTTSITKTKAARYELMEIAQSHQTSTGFSRILDGTLKQEEVRAHGRTHWQADSRRADHKESGKIGWCLETLDGIQTDDSH
ncbi:hypothetical protein Tco_1218675 [Tanacetum coccineum]